MRMIVVFEKGFAIRHIGHLDLMRTMQRALRRSGLPIQYSRGFNPHIQLSFAAPLSVGVVGLRELMDVPIDGEMDGTAFAEQLNAALPSCLRVQKARLVPDDFPTLMGLVAGSRMTIRLENSVAAAQTAAALPGFLQAKECVAMRKTKSGENLCNIRPFVKEASVEQGNEGSVIHCVLLSDPTVGALKPSVLIKALADLAGVDMPFFVAEREVILTKGKDGALMPLEDYNV